MFVLGNATFACGVRSARKRSFEEACGETEVERCLLAPEPCPLPPLALAPRTCPRHANRTPIWTSDLRGHYFAWKWTIPVVMLTTVVATTTTLSQTRARMQVILTDFTSILRKHFTGNNMFLREVNGCLRRLAYYKRALSLRNSWQLLWRHYSLQAQR